MEGGRVIPFTVNEKEDKSGKGERKFCDVRPNKARETGSGRMGVTARASLYSVKKKD